MSQKSIQNTWFGKHKIQDKQTEQDWVEPPLTYDSEGNVDKFLVAELHRGSFFGKEALLNRPVRTGIKAWCATNCHFLTIEREQVEQVVKMYESQV